MMTDQRHFLLTFSIGLSWALMLRWHLQQGASQRNVGLAEGNAVTLFTHAKE